MCTQHLQETIRIEGAPHLTEDDTANGKGKIGAKRLRDIRRSGVRLVDLHNGDLPYWYRLVLMARNESPLDAIEAILRLEKLNTSGEVKRCISDICAHFGITAPS